VQNIYVCTYVQGVSNTGPPCYDTVSNRLDQVCNTGKSCDVRIGYQTYFNHVTEKHTIWKPKLSKCDSDPKVVVSTPKRFLCGRVSI